ncbi:MAG: DNA repair protein RecO [Chlorobi bacterium]|nr:DNA repair protein RecO [Chlorobiota bacterium]
MIEQTEAIVLNARRFRETSKIVTLYTRSHGKISVVARGAMRPKSSFAGVLQPLAYLNTVIYIKEGRDLQNLSSAETVRRFSLVIKDLERTAPALEIIEIINAAIHEQEQNNSLFELIIAALAALNDSKQHPRLVFIQFLSLFCENLGFALHADSCGICNEEVEHRREGVPFSIVVGAPLCAEHRSATSFHLLNPGAFRLLQSLVRRSQISEESSDLSEKMISELQDVLIRFLKYHVKGLRTLRVGGITSTMLDK